MRKHPLAYLFLILICIPSYAQDWNEEVTEIEPVCATIDTAAINIIDTLFIGADSLKIVLYDNHTWEYVEPETVCVDYDAYWAEKYASIVNDTIGGWNTGSLHAFKNLDPSTITEDVQIVVSDLNPFCVPVKGIFRSGFRYRRSHAHKGVDISAHIGDTVRAMMNGVVRFSSGGRVTGGYGNLVIVRHDNNIETYHAHLSKRLVTSGEQVKAGQPVGLVGSTGRSTGPHLHFEIRYKGQAFDPQRMVDFDNGQCRDSNIVIKPHYFSMYSHYGQTDEESRKASDRIVHVVRSGDNLGKIAGKYQTSVSAICKLNGISSKKILHIGDRLIVR